MPERIKDYKVTWTHYLNDRDQPRVTTALVTTKEDCARGVAICSKKDQFNGKIGRKIAIGRAFKALSRKSNNGIIHRECALDTLRDVRLGLISYKSHYIKEIYNNG